MRNFKIIAFFLTAAFTSCINNKEVVVMSTEVNESAKLTTINFKIEGVDCARGKGEDLASRIIDLKGVSNIKLNCSDGETYVTYDVNLINPDSISTVINAVDSKLKINHLHTETDN